MNNIQEKLTNLEGYRDSRVSQLYFLQSEARKATSLDEKIRLNGFARECFGEIQGMGMVIHELKKEFDK